MKNLRELARLGTASISPRVFDLRALSATCDKTEAASLGAILEVKNGFYAFEGALHVLSDSGGGGETGLVAWNTEDLWRKDYEGMASGACFFAEDVFGGQFCLRNGSVSTFDPETGAFEVMAPNLEDWAGQILEDYSFWTGYRVAHDWQLKHDRLAVGSRLIPITPFVLGGEFDVANVHALEAVEGMRYRASIAVQLRDLPDGAKVQLKFVD